MDFNRLVFVCLTIIAFFKVSVNSTNCKDSAVTARIVKSCPQNVKEWNEAAAKKGCKKLSHSCPSFEYHCVINAWGNETIEVCAPSLMIIGNVCAEYSHGGKRIQRNGNAPCKKCPNPYFSNESYNYQECYENAANSTTLYAHNITTDSVDKESTTQEIVYSSSSLTLKEGSASPIQNVNTQNKFSHILTITICVVVGVAAVAIFFTVKQRPWANKICVHLKRKVFQSGESKITKSEIVISNVEEGPEVQNQLLGNATLTQDVFYESNESSEQ